MSSTEALPVVPEGPSRLQVFRRKLEVHLGKFRVYIITRKTGRLLAFQVGLACVALVGVAQYSVPIALIIGGVGGVLAVERQSR